VRGAFSIADPALVNAQHVLLVDDILTTGATARAAAQALIQAGAASVWVATLARAQRAHGFGREFNAHDLDPIAGAAPDEASRGSAAGSSLQHQPSF
jgi:adenine/guanine phosphoribosyltransferase-like PRPP-binding protein